MRNLRHILRRGLRFLALGLGVLALMVAPAEVRAQEATANLRAARLTLAQGSVTVDRTDNTGSQPAQVNLPLLAGVRVSTGQDGQAEIEFEDGSLLRLAPNSTIALDNLALDAGQGVFTTAVTLLHGLVYAELRAAASYRYRLDAGGAVMSPVENATVRVSFDQPPASFAVLDGTAKVERTTGGDGAGYTREVRAGETLQGDASDPMRYTLTQEISQDSWDEWNLQRDQEAAAQASERTGVRDNFAGAQGYGWSDLDTNGSWYDVPGTGEVWQPSVAAADASFDPYANGAWTYSAGTGYLYASAYPWGWTPYRCGSWSYFSGFGWGWAPAGGCGGLGWSFAGGGRPVNILYWPNGYRVPHVPVARPGPVHPIVPGRGVTGGGNTLSASTAVQPVPGAKRVNGVTVLPLERIGKGYLAQGGGPGPGTGAALARDFPVDRYSHAAIFGVESTQPAVVLGVAGWRSTAIRPAGTAGAMPAYRSPSSAYTPHVGGSAPARTSPSAGQTYSRPAPSSAPAVQHAAPPAPAAASHPAPAAVPAASRPK